MTPKKKREKAEESLKLQRLVNDDIRLNVYKPLYLVCGDESYLRLQYRNRLKTALTELAGEMNVLFAKGAETDPEELISFAETMPFFSEKRVLFVEDTGFFKNGCGALETYLKDPSKTAVFVFTETAVDKGRVLYKRVQDRGRIVLCEELTEEMLKKWIGSRLKEAGKAVQTVAADELLARTGTDMSRIASELEKLIAYTGDREAVTKKDVGAVCSDFADGKMYELTDALAEKDREKAVRSYQTMLAMNEPPAKILYSMTRQFELLLRVSEMHRMNAGMDTMMRVTGKRDFVISNSIRQARRITEPVLRSLLELCATNDRAVKRGLLDKNIAIEMVLVQATE